MTSVQKTENAQKSVVTVDFQEKLERIKKAIWDKLPILADIMSKHGDKSLYEYSLDFLDINPAPRLDSRKIELISEVENILAARLGQETAKKVAKQLKKFALVSTTDHHATIDDPFFVNSNLISSIPYSKITDPEIRYLVVLSFAGVSLNNTSGYARGIQFHGQRNGTGEILRIPIFPDKIKMGVVYNTRAYTQEDLDRLLAELSRRQKAGGLDADIAALVADHIKNIFGRAEILKSENLSEQITKINYAVWPQLFHNSEGTPDLIYLEIETLVANLLAKHHLDNPDSLIHKFIFDRDIASLTMRYFDDHAGAFSQSDNSGTYLFWAVNEKNYRVGLKRQNDTLVSHDGQLTFPLTPEGIRQALAQRQIFPSMMLCYLMISLYYGMKCLGGFSQVHDLTRIKESWRALLKEIGENEEAEGITPIQTKELGGDGLVLVYLEGSEDLVPASGIDMAIGLVKQGFSHYIEQSKKVTLSETMAPMLPAIYTVLYNQASRDPELAKITSLEILKYNRAIKKQHRVL